MKGRLATWARIEIEFCLLGLVHDLKIQVLHLFVTDISDSLKAPYPILPSRILAECSPKLHKQYQHQSKLETRHLPSLISNNCCLTALYMGNVDDSIDCDVIMQTRPILNPLHTNFTSHVQFRI